MRCWPFAPAVVLLLTPLLISAGSSQISGEGSKHGLRWVFQELKRQRGPTSGDERPHVRQQRRTAQSRCLPEQVTSPPGCRIEDPGCLCMCKVGMYLKNNQDCRLCMLCKPWQVTVKNCTNSTDTECSCKAGHYKDCNFSQDNCYDFSCSICTSCVAQNKTTLKDCSEREDATCGECLPGYNLSANNACLLLSSPPPPPLPPTQNPEIEHYNPAAPDFRWAYSLCVLCPLLLGTLLMCCKRRRTTRKPPSTGSLLSLPQPGLHMLRTPLSHSSPLQGRQFYAIIDVVPVRRWKEFVRSLGLRDSEIEAVELEHRQLREQQYEMLKSWRQKQGATMDAVLATLEEMELGGCAQELRQRLQPNILQPSP